MAQTLKKVLMVIAQTDFRDEEYFIPKSVLESAGFEVKTASIKRGEALGYLGGVVEVDLEVNKVKIDDFVAVVFAGGAGMAKNLDNSEFQDLAKQAQLSGKVIGGICIASVLLAKAGVLQGKKATVWSSPMDKKAVKILQENGAIFVDLPVVIDGNIITANGPQAARKFGEGLTEILKRV